MGLGRRQLLAGFIAAGGATALNRVGSAGAESRIGDNGLHIQDWFLESFLDLSDDHAEALDAGKHLAVIFEQRGCPYCRELHNVNLADPEILAFTKKHFAVLQLDLWGSRTVTDFDGTEMEERALARKWGVNFTPTMVFFPLESAEGKGAGSSFAVARMPGYLKPFHFVSFLEYVQEGAYKTGTFQQFLQVKFERLKAKGIKPKVW